MSRGIRTKMTDKEGSLAMWSWIMLCIIHDHDIRHSVRQKKAQWILRHRQRFDWHQNCWLCTRHQYCRDCPLEGCNPETAAYQKVCGYINYSMNKTQVEKERALEGCREILQAIEREEE